MVTHFLISEPEKKKLKDKGQKKAKYYRVRFESHKAKSDPSNNSGVTQDSECKFWVLIGNGLGENRV